MKALWQIILAILWRLRPVQALEVNLRDVIDIGLAMFADDLALDDITHDPAYRSTLAAAFFDAHRKLDLLIYLRACEIAGIRPRITSFKPDYSHTHKSTDLIALWRSFQRLVAKFDDYERYAVKRAERLKREPDNLPLRLAATLQSTSPRFTRWRQTASACSTSRLPPPVRSTGGGGLRALARKTEGAACLHADGCTQPARLLALYCLLPTAYCLSRHATENAPARPTPLNLSFTKNFRQPACEKHKKRTQQRTRTEQEHDERGSELLRG